MNTNKYFQDHSELYRELYTVHRVRLVTETVAVFFHQKIFLKNTERNRGCSNKY